MKRYIWEGLEEYLALNRKPWHMPGHKRKNYTAYDKGADINMAAFLSYDVTEVAGTDDLHHPENMILKSQQQLSDIYGSYASYYMVNGSTGGILSAIAAVAELGKAGNNNKIIVARNCHKSVYNAVKLFGLDSIYVEPEYLKLKEGYESHIYDEITPQQIKSLVKQYQQICAVVITSPTYEGVVSDVLGIKGVLEKYGIPLIVDEAHGAHLPFVKTLPRSAVSMGADIVVQSLHKTLPSLTQTAVIHVNSKTLNDAVKKYLSVFMSSSPSYPMLCSMEQAVVGSWEKMERNEYEGYLKILRNFRRNISNLKYIKLLEKDNYDESRIVLYGFWSGELMASRFRELGNIEVEMTGVNYVVLISTYMDEAEDFEQLEKTILLLDEELDNNEIYIESKLGNECHLSSYNELYKLVGNVAMDNIYVYPPGSYIVVAGEKISKEAVDKMIQLRLSGKRIIGL